MLRNFDRLPFADKARLLVTAIVFPIAVSYCVTALDYLAYYWLDTEASTNGEYLQGFYLALILGLPCWILMSITASYSAHLLPNRLLQTMNGVAIIMGTTLVLAFTYASFIFVT